MNDDLNNKSYIDRIKRNNVFFYTSNLNQIELKNYIYYQLFNKFYYDRNFFDMNIDYNKYEYSKDIEIFNPNRNIAFVTMYTKHIESEGREMEYSLKEYCIKNGYTCYIHRKSELEGKRQPCLEKPYLLKKYLDKHKYLIWIDSDILMFDQNYKIENIINNKCDMIGFTDPDINYPINSGFLIFKNSINSFDIIDKWIFNIEYINQTEFNGGTKGDQGILIDVIKKYHLNDMILYNNSEINCIINNYGSTNIKIMHLMGLYGFIRPLLMKYFNYLIFKK